MPTDSTSTSSLTERPGIAIMSTSKHASVIEFFLDGIETSWHSILIIAMRSMCDVFVLADVDRPMIIHTIVCMITQCFHATFSALCNL
jgi:hypothetical protein